MNNRKPTIFIIDDDDGVCKSIRLLLEKIDISAKTYGNVHEFLDAYDGQPGCLVLEVILPQITGLEFVSSFADYGISLPVIFLTGHRYVATAVEAMKLGALDFFEKPFGEQVLLDAIHRAIELDAKLRVAKALRSKVQAQIATLTPGERRVMNLLLRGSSAKKIACELGISQKTVCFHQGNVLRKMNADSVVNLILLVHEAGLAQGTDGA